ncbi:MAG TPA: GC-type dockerin domain-anchored protein [Phycisphaerales bacterium]|nr:GC-type dockerin domain-anchored protein [Phycisphaerales bacterium]
MSMLTRCSVGSAAAILAVAWLPSAALAQATDLCEDAPVVQEGTFQTPFFGAAGEGFVAPCEPFGTDGTAPDVWLDYVPAMSGTAIFNTCGLTSNDTTITVLDGCPSAGGSVLGCNDDYAIACSTLSLPVVAGQHYKVRIAKLNFGPPGLNPRVSIDFVPPCTAQPGAPVNDCCASATAITPSMVGVDTTGATRDYAGECGLGSPYPDVWYSFTPSETGNYRIKQASTADRLDYVIMTGGCASPTVVVCRASVETNIDQVVFQADAGTEYLIRVTGRDQPEVVSAFTLEAVSPPANDDCDTAQPISGFGQFDFDSTLANSSGPDDGTQCATFGNGNMTHDVWFLWSGQTPPGEDVEVTLCGGSPLDTKMSVYVAGCSGPTPLSPVVACNDDYCLGIQTLEPLVSRVVFRPAQGLSYLIRIGQFPNPQFDVAGAPGFFTINHIAECHVDMPAGATLEPEACGEDTNGGCFSPTLSYTALACGTTTIYGTAPAGDQDWFEFTTPVDTNVTVAFQSEFAGECDLLDATCPPGPFAIDLLRRNDGCAEFATPDFTDPIAAGTYHIAVVNYDAFATCDYHSHYVLTVSVERCAPLGRCCTGGACTVVTQAACEGGGGAYAGDDTTCPAVEGHYTDSATAGALEDISATGTALDACGDNCGQSDVPIGFTFNYFGTPLTTVDISTNGFLTFDPDFFLGSPYNSDVPGFLPHRLICALWQDYDTDATTGAGQVRYQTLGSAPNRRFVVEWIGLKTQDVDETSSTFEAVLFENGNIEFRYGAIDLASSVPTAGISLTSDVGTGLDVFSLGSGHTLTHVVDPNPCPACRVDFNHDGHVAVQDIFDFLNAWFAGSPSADFNGVNGLEVQDIFDFLNAWFAGC